MDELSALRSLARAMGVHTRYKDGLGRRVVVAPETLIRVCAALGARVERPADAGAALRAHRASRRRAEHLPPVLVAWDGALPSVPVPTDGPVDAEVLLEDGGVLPLPVAEGALRVAEPLPFGYHRLVVETAGQSQACTVVSAPTLAFRRP